MIRPGCDLDVEREPGVVPGEGDEAHVVDAQHLARALALGAEHAQRPETGHGRHLPVRERPPRITGEEDDAIVAVGARELSGRALGGRRAGPWAEVELGLLDLGLRTT